ncbi:DEAD/DEAH box helicase [Paenibacillus woosongensis]|uniref:ATP-dependent helicase n=1 Tax=Paenibacillus woosongensis TaxID=307580 RepID=A0A7X3CPS4_9BACL|nr:DEAD/DEAH box helicase [Paenibacillus woosongensis]MUG46467.1 ATP-dependent helicase [Paenibacillus woosongensis]
MNQRLYAIWLGEVLFCFSGETSESKIDAWAASLRRLETAVGKRPFQQAALRLAEVRYPASAGRSAFKSGERRGLIGRTLEGLALPVQDAWPLLLGWNEAKIEAQGFLPGQELEFWSKAAKFALELMMKGRIAPGMAEVPLTGNRRPKGQASAKALWGPELDDPVDEERFRLLAGSMPPICLAAVQLGGMQEEDVEARQIAVLYSFMSAILDHEVRKAVGGLGRKLNASRADYRRGTSPLAELWWNGLLAAVPHGDMQGTVSELAELAEGIRDAGGGEPKVQHEDDEGRSPGTFRLCLRLEPAEEEAAMPAWRLSLWAEGVEDPGVLLPYGLIWSYPERDIEIRGRVYHGAGEQLLHRLGKAARLSRAVRKAMECPRPEGTMLQPEEVFALLSKEVAQLRRHGITVQMPSRWTKEGRRTAGVRLRTEQWGTPSESGQGPGSTPRLGVEQLVAYEAEAVFGGSPLSEEELNELASSKSPLVFFRGEWVEIDVKEIRQVLKFMKRYKTGEMSFRELMHLTVQEEGSYWDGLPIEQVETAGLLSLLLEGHSVRGMDDKPVPSLLRGTLRPYQERGYRWLVMMRQLGFGALLADDMGLGKTVQVIAALLDGIEAGTVLIICPTSLLGNWQKELSRFAPELKLHIHHGSGRLHGEEFREECAKQQVVLTTYPLAGRDMKELQSVEWASIVLDEAQYIKNYGTKQAQSVMKLNAPHRIAMTGTPVENRLSELWSIFQFLNPGYLGGHSSFKSKYAGSSEQQPAELARLRQLIAPFLLRRLKSDPDIRKDLPDKIELKSYCPLMPAQAELYREAAEDLLGRIAGSTGITRKGIVLSTLTRLKQICDHPLLVTGAKETRPKVEASGKMERLLELLDLIIDNNEAALIFTQYVQMGKLLCEALEQKYGMAPAFLHGGVSKAERDQMVEDFQQGGGSPFFVLSLKAGGVGLNLTRANHVIHYDRWWNPAVENQATDRVFRIGQKRNVEVHKLICQGTLEERIDELIERKKTLSEQVVGSGEQWLTEMSNEELQHLIELQN